MSALLVRFTDILANWPQLCLIYTAGDHARHHRTHVHHSPKDPDQLVLVRIDSGQVISISYVHRTELAALVEPEMTAAH